MWNPKNRRCFDRGHIAGIPIHPCTYVVRWCMNFEKIAMLDTAQAQYDSNRSDSQYDDSSSSINSFSSINDDDDSFSSINDDPKPSQSTPS